MLLCPPDRASSSTPDSTDSTPPTRRLRLQAVERVSSTDVAYLASGSRSGAGGDLWLVRAPHPGWLAAGGRESDWLAPWVQVQHDAHPLQPSAARISRVNGSVVVLHRFTESVDLLQILETRIRDGRLVPIRHALAAAVAMVDVALWTSRHAPGPTVLAAGLGPHRVRVGLDGGLEIDAGFASADTRGFLANTMGVGECAYVAPEVVDGRVHGAAADVWAIGLMLDHAALGWNRMQGHDIGETLVTIRNGADDAGWSFLSPELRRLVQQCLKSDPRERPAMDAALREWLASELVAAGGAPDAGAWAMLAVEAYADQARGAVRAWECWAPEVLGSLQLLDACRTNLGVDQVSARAAC